MAPLTEARRKAEEVLLAHRHYIYSVATRNCPYPGCGEDIVQEVCVDFIANAEKWDLSNPFRVKRLLKILTINAAKRLWHEHSRLLPGKLREVANYVRKRVRENEQSVENMEDMALIRRCLTNLPPESQNLLERYYFRGETSRAISEECGMKEDTVRRELSRSREKLREQVRKYTGEYHD